MPTGMHEHTHPSTSEFWLNGEMCSRAELIRSQMKQGKLQDEVNKAAIERSQAGYDAGHWLVLAACRRARGALLPALLRC